MAVIINRLEVQQNSRKLLSQTIVNLKEIVSAISLRNGKEIEMPLTMPLVPSVQEKKTTVTKEDDERYDSTNEEIPKGMSHSFSIYEFLPHFSQALELKYELNSDLYETLTM